MKFGGKPPGPMPARTGAPKREGGPRINEEIRVRQVRLVGADGEMLGVVPVEEAMHRAREAGLDLVEVSPNAEPPVCKILDFGKFKYEQQKKSHEARKKQKGGELKEIRLRPKTDKHDLQVKLNKVTQFLEEGHKVQLTVLFRGREMQHKDIGARILREIAAQMEEVAKIERDVMSEGRRMFLLLMPKPGASAAKKGSDESKPNG